MKKRNIRLLISYDGTDYAGWQVQSEQESVQGRIEDALKTLHGHPVSLTGAGRTDSGVHAVGQVGNFFTDMESVSSSKFEDALNVRLPRDIRILESCMVDESFHSRRSAKTRCYEYRIIINSSSPAHQARYVWLLKKPLALAKLNEMASVLCGTHDFSSFAKSKNESDSFVRRIDYAVFHSSGPMIIFRIQGNAFLWRMVRSIVGTLVNSFYRGGNASSIQNILESCNRETAGPTAPAQGLFLTKVTYD